MDIKKIKEMSRERRKIRKEAFKFILELCYNKIEKFALSGVNFCYYDIPPMIFGYPKYSMDECSNYLIKKLKDDFDVKLVKQKRIRWNGPMQEIENVYTLTILWDV